MSLVWKRRESRPLGGVHSEARTGHLLTAKRAIIRNGSPGGGLFDLCCIKKARELRKKCLTQWGFHRASRNICAGQQACEPCTLCTHYTNPFESTGYTFWRLHCLVWISGLRMKSEALGVLLFVTCIANRLQIKRLLYICMSGACSLHLTFIYTEWKFSLPGKAFMGTCKKLASNLASRFQTRSASLSKERSHMFVLSLH